MKKFTVTVMYKEGLHARPASQLTKVCQNVKSKITIFKNETQVDPKSILGILTLGARYQDQLDIEVSGEDEDVVAANLEAFFTES